MIMVRQAQVSDGISRNSRLADEQETGHTLVGREYGESQDAMEEHNKTE